MDSKIFGTDKSVSSNNSFQSDQLIEDFVSQSRLGSKRTRLDHTSDAELPRFELAAANTNSAKALENTDQRATRTDSTTKTIDTKKPETVLEIADVGKRVGWWQQKEYQKLGVQRIRLGDHSVAMELAKPVSKGAIVTSLDIDKVFAFNFDRGPNKWELSNVKGLKVGGDPVSGVEITPNKKVIFWLDKNKTEKREYGKQAAEFIKALADPLMADYLRR